MKLRNKKTGKIVDLSVGFVKDTCYGEFIEIKPVAISKESYLYGSLAELNEEWEDYKPKEPLIKDEDIRKAVRAWAEACAVEKCHYDGDGDFATRWHGIKLDGSQIELDEGHYTIAELCGEENEED